MSTSNLEAQESKNSIVLKQKGISIHLAHIRVELDQAKMKILIVSLVLLFTGLTSVLSQKYMNEILASVGYALQNPPTPTMGTFLQDFLGNSTLFVIIIILLGMGTFSNELDVNKQVYFTLSRPISRSEYFFTRSLVLTIGMTLATILASLIVYVYATMFFTPMAFDKLILILLLVSFQYASIYTIMIMFSSQYGSATAGLLGFVTYLSEVVISIFEPLKWFSTIALSNDWIKIYNDSISASDLTLEFLTLFIWTIVPLIIGWFIYQRRDL